MREDHPRKPLLMFPPKKYTKTTGYLLLLALAYTLGFYTSSTLKPLALQAPQEVVQQLPKFSPEPDLLRFRSRCSHPIPSKLVRQNILDRIFNGSSPFNDFPPPHASALLRKKRVKGWGSTGAVFENLIRGVRPRTIIEVGSFLGASAIHMAGLTRKMNLKTQILCVDDFRGWPGFRDRFKDIKMVNGDVVLMYQFMQNVVHFNASDVILPVPFSSSSVLAKFCEWGIYADLIEVDAGHDFHSAWTDINYAYQILSPGGVMFGHDYFTAADNRGVRRAVNLFAKLKGLKVQLDGLHWVIGSG